MEVPTKLGARYRPGNQESMSEGLTAHRLILGDARTMQEIDDESIHLIVTSPPYADLKTYDNESGCQLGSIDDYERFLAELDRVWAECRRVLVPGGRICCVVGDVCISRRSGGRHYVLPLSSDIQVRARNLDLDCLTPIRWYKVANVALEASSSARYLGKPNLPGGIIKNDIETIVFLRKPGAYRSPSPEMEAASRIGKEDYAKWFRAIWTDITGASTRDHPAPYPVALAERLVRMFSFAGDIVLDPFAGTGTTAVAARRVGRSSVSYEVEPRYFDMMRRRLAKTDDLLSLAASPVEIRRPIAGVSSRLIAATVN